MSGWGGATGTWCEDGGVLWHGPLSSDGVCLPNHWTPGFWASIFHVLASVSLSQPGSGHSACPPCLCVPQHSARGCPGVFSLFPPWSFQTQQGAAFRSPSWSPFSCLMPPKYCGHPGLPVSTSLYRPSPLSWPTENDRWPQPKPGHFCPLPGHKSPGRIRLSSEDAPV